MRSTAVIVVGVAASPETQHVLDASRTIAKRLGAKLHVVHAVGLSPGMPLDALSAPAASLTEALRAEAEAFLRRVQREIDPAELDRVSIVEDVPWRALCDVASREHAVMIIVGAHDPRLLDALLGTTAAKVTNRAETRVLVVRRHTQAVLHTLAYHQVLVALDGSLRAPMVLDTAMRIAHDEHARVTLLRVVTPPNAVAARHLGAPASLEERLKALALADLEQLKASVPSSAPTKLAVHVGGPWQRIIETAASINADLIVIGSHGYDPIDRVLGTTAAKVVNHTDRSVLIAR